MNDDEVSNLLRQVDVKLKEVRELFALTAMCEDSQWLRSHRPSVESVMVTSGGPPSDPTADAALDEGRLELRRQLHTAGLKLSIALTNIAAAKHALKQGQEAWFGESF